MEIKVSEKKNKFQWLTRSTWPLLGIAIFLLLVITIIWIFPVSRSLKKEVSKLQIQLTEKAFLELRHFFEFQKEHLIHLSYGLAETKDLQRKESLMKRFLGHQIQEIVLLDKTGKEEIRVSVVEKFVPSKLGNSSQTKKFLELKQEELFLGDIFWEDETSFIEMAIPIQSLTGEIQNILMAKINLTSLWDALYEIRMGETGIIYVVDKNGQLIFHPRETQFLEGVNLLKWGPVSIVIQEGRKVKGLSREDIYINEEGVRVHAAGMLFPEFYWGILFEQATRESYQARNQLMIVAVILLGIGFVLSYFLSKLVLALTTTSQALQKAKLGLEEERESLKIKIIARTKELKELAKGLEEKVKQRTGELQERIDELERFHKLTVGRELKMVELKEEIAKLKTSKGRMR